MNMPSNPFILPVLVDTGYNLSESGIIAQFVKWQVEKAESLVAEAAVDGFVQIGNCGVMITQ